MRQANKQGSTSHIQGNTAVALCPDAAVRFQAALRNLFKELKDRETVKMTNCMLCIFYHYF